MNATDVLEVSREAVIVMLKVGAPILSIFRARARPAPIRIAMMERHPLASQAFFPLSDHPWLVVVSSAEKPAPNNLKAFLAHGRQGVQYAKNAWHHPLLIIEPSQDFLGIVAPGQCTLRALQFLLAQFFRHGAILPD